MHSIWVLLALTVIFLVQETTSQTCSEPTTRCKKAKGNCISKNEPCLGDAKNGRKWCKDGKKCKCCIGNDKACGDGAEQPPCSVLGGHCMNRYDKCKGREVYSQYFCSGSSCKCCIPQEVCPSCEDKAGDQCSFEVFGMTVEGVCKDNCKEGEMRLGDCGPNCGCCVSVDIPSGSCDNELEKPCTPYGIPYSGTCRANCNGDEIRMGPCENSNNPMRRFKTALKPKQGASRYGVVADDDCGCCISVDSVGKR